MNDVRIELKVTILPPILGRARRIFPNDFFLTFVKGILLKRHHKGDKERKREGNRLLRSLDLEDEEGEDIYSKVAAVNDLTQRLRRQRGREDDIELIFKEASKLHLFISPTQRPLEAVPDLETRPVWNLGEDVGLTTHEEGLAMLR